MHSWASTQPYTQVPRSSRMGTQTTSPQAIPAQASREHFQQRQQRSVVPHPQPSARTGTMHAVAPQILQQHSQVCPYCLSILRSLNLIGTQSLQINDQLWYLICRICVVPGNTSPSTGLALKQRCMKLQYVSSYFSIAMSSCYESPAAGGY